MQLRFAIELTLEEYVTREGWKAASLERCPAHPDGGCGFARHGTYWRKIPLVCKVARWYCPTGHRTFSLLPDCLAARMTGTLQRAERSAVAVERGGSLELWRKAPDAEAKKYVLREPQAALQLARSSQTSPDPRLGPDGAKVYESLLVMRQAAMRIVRQTRVGLEKLGSEGALMLEQMSEVTSRDCQWALKQVRQATAQPKSPAK